MSTGSILPGGPTMAVVQSHGQVRLVQPFIVSVTARHEFRANSWLATLRLGSWSHDDAAIRLRSVTGNRGRLTPGEVFTFLIKQKSQKKHRK